jgi:hypothetical protein
MKRIARVVRRALAAVCCISLLALMLTFAQVKVAGASPGPFRPLAPTRLMDTRVGLGGAALGPGEVRTLGIAGRAGIPADATAVVLNVTATEPSVGGFVTVWPSGQPQPATSNLNFLANQTVPNLVTVGLGAGGSVDLSNAFGTSHLIVDATGWFAPGIGFTGAQPARLMDTRAGLGGSRFGAGESQELGVVGVAGVPSNAVAVALNVTVTDPVLGGFITVWPAGTARPPSSNLNMQDGQTVANMVLVGVGSGGRVSIYNDNGLTDVLVDVMGWFEPGGGFTGLTPARILDTRASTCGATLRAGETRTLAVTGRSGVPGSGVGAVALNVTATNASQQSFLTVWPTGQTRPNTSNLNMTAGRNVANLVAVGVGDAGQVSIYNDGGTVDVVIDVMGHFAGDTPAGSLVACPPQVHIFGDGTHVVGQTVPAGRYVTSGSGSCYWERLRGFSGAFADIISNDIGGGQRIVDIKPTDVGFASSRCGTWVTFVASFYSPASSFGDGIYAVGSQIVPGRYQATGTDGCYWERLSGFSGEFSELIANDIGDGTRIVDISASDVGIGSSRCGTWVRIA